MFGVDRIPTASTVILLAAGAATGVFTFAVLRRAALPLSTSVLATAFFLLQPAILVASTAGMETMVVVMLMSASLYAASASRYELAAALCGLLVLVRIDGVLWTACVLLFVAVERRRLLRLGLVFFCVVAPWVAFAGWYFGSFVPHSVAAKREIATPLGGGADFLERFGDYLPWFLAATGAHFHPVPSDWSPLLAVGSLLLIAIGSAAVFAGSSLRSLRPLVLFPPLVLLALAAGRAPRIFDWYLVPPLWAWAILLVVGASRLLGALGDLAGRRTRVAAALALGVLFAGHLAVTNRAEFFYTRRVQEFDQRLNRKLGRWFLKNTAPSATILTEAIGYQGWYSRRRIIDLAGLVSPEVVEIHRESGGSSALTFHRVLGRMDPDFVVLRSYEVDRNRAFHGGSLFETPDQRAFFDERYREVVRMSAVNPGFAQDVASLTVFERTRRQAFP